MGRGTDPGPSGSIPPPSSGAFSNILSIDTGPALTFDLASTINGEVPDSPITITSSGSGVTYSFPLPTTSEAHVPLNASSPSSSAPPLPARPTARQDIEPGLQIADSTVAPPLPARPDVTRQSSLQASAPEKTHHDTPGRTEYASQTLSDSQSLSLPAIVDGSASTTAYSPDGPEREKAVSSLPPGAAPPHWKGEVSRKPAPRE